MTTLPTIPGLTLTAWPTEPARRRSLTTAAIALGYRDVLARWAHGAAVVAGATSPTRGAWAALLGVGSSTLAAWRAADPTGLGALPLAPRGDARRWGRRG